GTIQKPWRFIQHGINQAAPGAIVAVAQGTYVEDLVIQGKSVKLWGRCPDLVMVKGTSAAPSALQFVGGLASKSEVHGLAMTGASRGLVVGGASAVVVSGVWVHDTEADG